MLHRRQTSRIGRWAAALLAMQPWAASASASPSYNELVQQRLQPQTEALLGRLIKEGHALSMDATPVFNAKDKFLPGKIAIGLVDYWQALPAGDPRVPAFVKAFRQIAALTIDDANEAWGIYYYMLALNQLRRAGLLQDAVDPLTLDKLRSRLDWRSFVNATNFSLIDAPNNYYGVAFGIARLRAQMGWEQDGAAEKLYARIAEHYRRYSGEFGFADETEGEGRFDRYSVLLSAEIANRFLESGGQPPPEVLKWLRKSVDVMLVRLHASGEGFEYGRSLGPYGETAIIEVLTVAAAVGVLDDRERALAYSYATRALQRYLSFWLDKTTGAVNLWDGGRRTDAYRGRFRRFSENLSLTHQFCYTNALWNTLGFGEQAPLADFSAALRSMPVQTVTWFARGRYDRVLLTRRDGEHVIGLPLINGGASQHQHSAYFPIPFARGMLSGVADGSRPLLLPQLQLSDGSTLMPLAFFRGVQIETSGTRTTVSYRQTELDRVGDTAPIADDRLSVATQYEFARGRITRTDVFTPRTAIEISGIELDFGSFSRLAHQLPKQIDFTDGAVEQFSVSGLDGCQAQSITNDPEFESDLGPMLSKVICTLGRRKVRGPFSISWTLVYH
jgi:hypothetical protein